MTHWTPPSGPVNSHTRAWCEFRAAVRATAARWCDNPSTLHQGHGEGAECTGACELHSCGECSPCEAVDLVQRGVA